MSITLSWIFLREKITNTRKTEEKKYIRREYIKCFCEYMFHMLFLVGKNIHRYI